MKKLLLIAATTTALMSSLSAAACEGCEPEASPVVPVATVTTLTTNINQFYFKAEGGASFLNKAKDKFFDVKMKSRAAGAFGVGVGYYLMDNVRTDITFNMLINPLFKSTFDPAGNPNFVKLYRKIYPFRPLQTGKHTMLVKHKGKVMTLLLNGYVDLFPIGDVAKIFVGGGVGLAQIKEKISVSGDGEHLIGVSVKKANNFTYQATIGASVDLTDTIKGEISYSFRDYGKTKGGTDKFQGQEVTIGKTSYKTHNITVGFRFNM